MADVCRIVVVDIEPIFRDGVMGVLRRDQGFVVAAQGTTAQEAEHLAREHGPDVLLLEAAVPGSLGAAQAILDAHQSVKVVFLASIEDEEHASQALRIGVHGYIMKSIAAPELVHAIAMVHSGGRYISHDLSWRLVTNRAPSPASGQITDKSLLSLREQKILEHTLRGLTNRQIASKLGLSLGTTKYHKTIAFRKLGVNNRLAMVARMNEVAKHGGRADMATLISLPRHGQAVGGKSARCSPPMERPSLVPPSKRRRPSPSARVASAAPSTGCALQPASRASPSKNWREVRGAPGGSGNGTTRS